MVFYFTSNVVKPEITLYMGKDKYENEDLIKYGWPEDIWFHVDKLSSAHVYLRMQPGWTLDTIPDALVQDCAQLTKANSIEGCKLSNVQIVYTLWSNLKKTGDMDVGQVSFHNDREVRRIKIDKSNDIVNRLNKTKREDHPDLFALREQRDREEREEKKRNMREQQRIEKAEAERRSAEKEQRSYSSLMNESKMKSNIEVKKTVTQYEDDFM